MDCLSEEDLGLEEPASMIVGGFFSDVTKWLKIEGLSPGKSAAVSFHSRVLVNSASLPFEWLVSISRKLWLPVLVRLYEGFFFRRGFFCRKCFGNSPCGNVAAVVSGVISGMFSLGKAASVGSR